jgi:hypothetical protein
MPCLKDNWMKLPRWNQQQALSPPHPATALELQFPANPLAVAYHTCEGPPPPAPTCLSGAAPSWVSPGGGDTSSQLVGLRVGPIQFLTGLPTRAADPTSAPKERVRCGSCHVAIRPSTHAPELVPAPAPAAAAPAAGAGAAASDAGLLPLASPAPPATLRPTPPPPPPLLLPLPLLPSPGGELPRVRVPGPSASPRPSAPLLLPPLLDTGGTRAPLPCLGPRRLLLVVAAPPLPPPPPPPPPLLLLCQGGAQKPVCRGQDPDQGPDGAL